jgi:hypothetical protein
MIERCVEICSSFFSMERRLCRIDRILTRRKIVLSRKRDACLNLWGLSSQADKIMTSPLPHFHLLSAGALGELNRSA